MSPFSRTLSFSLLLHGAFMAWVLSIHTDALKPSLSDSQLRRFIVISQPVKTTEQAAPVELASRGLAMQAFPWVQKATPEPAKPVAQPPPPKTKKQVKKRQRRKRPAPSKKVHVIATRNEAAPVKQVEAPAAPDVATGEAEAVVAEAAPAPAPSHADLPTGPIVDLSGLRRDYLGSLNTYMKRSYSYPRRARRAGVEGTVLVEVTVGVAGEILSSRLLRSSGHDVLDNAALKTVASLEHVPTPPSALNWGRRAVRIPFRYSLES